MFRTMPAHQFDTLNVDMRHTLLLFAKALNYVGIDDCYHSHRVAYISANCAHTMRWNAKKVQKSFFAGLIHDCGVSKSTEHEMLLKQMRPDDVEAHCHRGYEALIECSILRGFAQIIRHHHTPWELLSRLEMNNDDRDIAALIFLADRVDYLRATHVGHVGMGDEYLLPLHKEEIEQGLRMYAGSLFRPDFVEAMCQLIATDSFWYKMDVEHIESTALSFDADPWYDQTLTITELMEVAMFLARLVDAKSPFTYHHSLRVANLVYFLAERMNLSAQTCDLLYVSGLVHDVGKLRTPNELLNKTSELTANEFAQIKRHAIYTELALNKVFPDSKICEWAANHHEFLDGSGYPYQKKGDELDLPSRILTFCDIFQALSQDRPYRERMSLEKKLQFMSNMVLHGKIDGEVFSCALDNLLVCESLACD